MTMAQIAGWIMISTPFIFVAVAIAVTSGWRTSCLVFGSTALTAALMYFGVFLVNGSV